MATYVVPAMAPTMTRKSLSPPDREKEQRIRNQRGVSTATSIMTSAMQYKTVRILFLHLWRPPQGSWCLPCSAPPEKLQQKEFNFSHFPDLSPLLITRFWKHFFTNFSLYKGPSIKFQGIQVLCNIQEVLVFKQKFTIEKWQLSHIEELLHLSVFRHSL